MVLNIKLFVFIITTIQEHIDSNVLFSVNNEKLLK